MTQLIEVDSGQVFSGKPTGNKVIMWAQPNDYTPTVDPNYMFPAWASDIVVWLLTGREPLYLFGPTGCGKTTCVSQIVAKLNYPVYSVTGHNRMEFPELVGHWYVNKGSMEYEFGPLTRAMRDGGLFLFNEIDLLAPDTFAGMNNILDGAPLVIPEAGGMIIKPHPMFKFVATANSNGGGDSTGLYQGVLRMNLAAMDRFVMVEAGYLDEKVEQVILRKHAPTLPPELTDKMVKFANAMRKLFTGDDAEGVSMNIEVTCSTRTLIRWAYLISNYEPLKSRGVDVCMYALERALLFRASKATQITLKELWQRIGG